MRVHWLLALSLLHAPAQGEKAIIGQILQADRLRNEGQPKAAVEILEPLLRSNNIAADQAGFAWNVLGSSYFVQRGLSIVDAARGRNNVAYFRVEMIYAGILRASGDRERGSQLEKQVSGSLAELQVRECSGCTINASAFR
jgi:hypothetical protein